MKPFRVWQLSDRMGVRVIGTHTRRGSIRIVGPLPVGQVYGHHNVVMDYYYWSLHTYDGSSGHNGYNGYTGTLLEAMHQSLASSMVWFEYHEQPPASWAEMLKCLKEEHIRMKDEEALKALAGKK